MGFVRRSEKGRLVMVETPSACRRRRIRGSDDRVLVAIEHLFVKKIAGAVQQARVTNLGGVVNAFLVEPREGGRGSDAVKTVPVVEDAKFHQDLVEGLDQKAANLSNTFGRSPVVLGICALLCVLCGELNRQLIFTTEDTEDTEKARRGFRLAQGLTPLRRRLAKHSRGAGESQTQLAHPRR